MSNFMKTVYTQGVINGTKQYGSRSRENNDHIGIEFDKEVAEFCLNCKKAECNGKCDDYIKFIKEYKRRLKNG